MPGPAKTPTALRLLRGAATGSDPSHRPLPKHEPKPEALTAEQAKRLCPKEYSDRQRHWWRYYSGLWAGMRVLTRADIPLMDQMSKIADEREKAEALVAKHGPLLVMASTKKECRRCNTTGTCGQHVCEACDGKGYIMAKPGYAIVHPAYQLVSQLRDQETRLLKEFGGSPAARTRVQTVGTRDASQSDDPWAKL